MKEPRFESGSASEQVLKGRPLREKARENVGVPPRRELPSAQQCCERMRKSAAKGVRGVRAAHAMFQEAVLAVAESGSGAG